MGRWAQARKRGTDRGAGPAFAYAPPAAGDWTLTLAFITATIHIVSSPVGPTNYLVAESFDSGGPYGLEGSSDIGDDYNYAPVIDPRYYVIAWADVDNNQLSPYSAEKVVHL